MAAKCPRCGNTEKFYDRCEVTDIVDDERMVIEQGVDSNTLYIECASCQHTLDTWEEFEKEAQLDET